jgi:hypothetical protein
MEMMRNAYKTVANPKGNCLLGNIVVDGGIIYEQIK